mgnify:CR=1 FL=1
MTSGLDSTYSWVVTTPLGEVSEVHILAQARHLIGVGQQQEPQVRQRPVQSLVILLQQGDHHVLRAGGAIVGPGVPVVLIGAMPASVMGDMTVCPMVTGVVPHVGGPITKGSVTVLIGARPAVYVATAEPGDDEMRAIAQFLTGAPVRDVRPPYGHLTPALLRWCRATAKRQGGASRSCSCPA